MKKFILLILLFLMFIPFVANAETCDTDKITISSITVENKSDNVEELDEATANGKNINLNLSMSEVGDNIEFKFVVKNDSNEDYKLDKTSLNLNSDYINYSFETEDNTNIVKANSSKIVYLKVEYKNEVPVEKFEFGTYNDRKTMTVNLSTGDIINVLDTLKNPNTGVQSYIIILTLILIISITLFLILRRKKYINFMILIFGIAFIIPISVFALCKCEIKVESSILIKEREYNITYYGISCSAAYGCQNYLIEGDVPLPGALKKVKSGTQFNWTYSYLRQCYYTDLDGNELGNCQLSFIMPAQDIKLYYEFS